ETTFDPGCGLQKPTAELWHSKKAEIKEFVDRNWNAYLSDKTLPATHQFAMYLRDKYAPSAAPSSFFCDVVGQCSIGSCSNLDTKYPVEERQLAYLVFEQMAGVDHAMKASARATELAGNYMLKVATTAAGAFILLAAGALGVSPFFAAGATSMAVAGVALNMASAGYIGTVGLVNTASLGGLIRIQSDLTHQIQGSMNEILHIRSGSIDNDMRDLMIGNLNNGAMDITDVLLDKDFLAPDPNLQTLFRDKEEQYLFATTVNSVWRFDRPYIVEADAVTGIGCTDDLRGHSAYRVCLPERPYKSFWLYAIDQGRENDKGKNDQAQVSGPTGFRHFDYARAATYNITKEDIVRSSLFVHKHKLDNGMDLPLIGKAFRSEGVKLPKLQKAMDRVLPDQDTEVKAPEHLGLVPGAFTIPICRNPGGEAISSVHKDKARNYPCMCGEFSWKKGWSIEKDETKRFLHLTGFKYSEDWEDYCSDHNHCKGQNNIDWHSEFNSMRREGDPQIPEKLKHPFRKCKEPKKHNDYG
ncbi:hypothetical protein FB567DRAFT_428776, partial [Paraphoma chrysanthemicola]